MTVIGTNRRFGHGIEVEPLEEGLLVRQGEHAYVARNWRLSSSTEELIETAVRSGLSCMIRNDHPRRNARWPNRRGVVYLAFSPGPEKQWSVAIDTFRSPKNDFGTAVFNGKYHSQFADAGIAFSFERRNRSAGHLVVARRNVIPTLRALAEFDHSVLSLGRATHSGEGFTTEYVLQDQILKNWHQTPWATKYDIVQDEYPVDGGYNSRRIDILARDRQSGDWLIIELKRAEASEAAVNQVAEYLLALGKQDEFACGQLKGVLVAERVPTPVRAIAGNEGVQAYEARWPLELMRVA